MARYPAIPCSISTVVASTRFAAQRSSQATRSVQLPRRTASCSKQRSPSMRRASRRNRSECKHGVTNSTATTTAGSARWWNNSMPKRTDISSILIIGAGPIVIGQACEFDYSGTQACKALKEEGYRVVLVNSNPATIMTDPELADATYIEPITPEIVAKIIERERYVIPGGF